MMGGAGGMNNFLGLGMPGLGNLSGMAGMGLNITAGVGISFGLNEGGVLLRSEMKKVLLYFT